MKVSAGWGYLTYVLYIQVRLIYDKALNTVHFQVKINLRYITRLIDINAN